MITKIKTFGQTNAFGPRGVDIDLKKSGSMSGANKTALIESESSAFLLLLYLVSNLHLLDASYLDHFFSSISSDPRSSLHILVEYIHKSKERQVTAVLTGEAILNLRLSERASVDDKWSELDYVDKTSAIDIPRGDYCSIEVFSPMEQLNHDRTLFSFSESVKNSNYKETMERLLGVVKTDHSFVEYFRGVLAYMGIKDPASGNTIVDMSVSGANNSLMVYSNGNHIGTNMFQDNDARLFRSILAVFLAAETLYYRNSTIVYLNYDQVLENDTQRSFMIKAFQDPVTNSSSQFIGVVNQSVSKDFSSTMKIPLIHMA